MKCLAHKKQFDKAKKGTIDRGIRLIIRYMTAATAEIMLEKFHWSQDRLLEFLQYTWHNFDLTNTPLADVDSFNPDDNFGYNTRLRNKLVRQDVSQLTQAIDAYTDQSLRWFIDVMVYTLKDSYGWADSTTDRFVRYIDGYIPKLRDNNPTLDQLCDHLKEEHNLELRMHLV